MASFDLKAVITAEDKASPVIGRFSKSVEDSHGTLAGITSAALKFGTAAVGSFTAAAGFAIKSAADMQMLRTNFDTLLGSAEKGADLFKQLQKMANVTPFETKDLAQASQVLLSMGIRVENLLPSLQQLGDVSLGNKQKFNQLTLAFGQIASRGKLAGDDLRQLIAVGFNPLQKIADRTGESVESLQDKMSKGQITFQMVQDEFVRATSSGGQFFEGMKKGSITLEGTLSTLQDAIGMTARRIVGLDEDGNAIAGGSFEKIGQAVLQLTQYLNEHQVQIVAVGTAMENVLVKGIEMLIDILKVAGPIIMDIFNFFKDHEAATTALKIAVETLVAQFLLLKTAMAITDTVSALTGVFKLLVEQLGAANTGVLVLKGSLTAIPTGIVITIGIASVLAAIDAAKKLSSEMDRYNDSVNQAIDQNNKLLQKANEYEKAGMLDKAKRLRDLAKESADTQAQISKDLNSNLGFWQNLRDGFKSMLGIGTRASGGPIDAGRPYLVGEHGPEIVVPRGDGMVIPNHQLAGAGGINITQYNTFARPSDPVAAARELAFSLQRR